MARAMQFLIGIVVALPAAAGLAPASQTAKTDLAEAAKAARAWRSDAVLCWISTAVADKEGKAPAEAGWVYHFCSKSAGKSYELHRMPAGFTGSEVAAARREPLPQDFVDSDQAMAEARRAGYSTEESVMRLEKLSGGSGAAWIIFSLDAPGKRFQIDAQSGKLMAAK